MQQGIPIIVDTTLNASGVFVSNVSFDSISRLTAYEPDKIYSRHFAI